ncbi:MAG: hypothetical protein V4480_02160 [Patescibacteria group bacterium]
MKHIPFTLVAVLYVAFVVLSFLSYGYLDVLTGAVPLARIFSSDFTAPYVLQQDALNFLSLFVLILLVYVGIRLSYFLRVRRKQLRVLIVLCLLLALSISSYDQFYSWFPYYSDFYRIFLNIYTVLTLVVGLALLLTLRHKRSLR